MLNIKQGCGRNIQGVAMSEDINARVVKAEKVTFEDVLQMSVEELRKITPALETRAVVASKVADQAVADAADAIAVAAAAQSRLQTLQEQDAP
jgi:hypothetical protein